MRWCVSPRPPVPPPPTSSRPRCRHPGIRFASLAPAASASRRPPAHASPPSRSFSSPPPGVPSGRPRRRVDTQARPLGPPRRDREAALRRRRGRRFGPPPRRPGNATRRGDPPGRRVRGPGHRRRHGLPRRRARAGDDARGRVRDLRAPPPPPPSGRGLPRGGDTQARPDSRETNLVAGHFPPPSSRRLLERQTLNPKPPARAPPVCSKRRVAWGEAKTIGSRAHEGGRPRDRDRDEDGDVSRRRRFFERDVGRRVARRGCVVRARSTNPSRVERGRRAPRSRRCERRAPTTTKNENAGVEPKVGDVVLGDGAVAEALELALFLASPGGGSSRLRRRRLRARGLRRRRRRRRRRGDRETTLFFSFLLHLLRRLPRRGGGLRVAAASRLGRRYASPEARLAEAALKLAAPLCVARGGSARRFARATRARTSSTPPAPRPPPIFLGGTKRP